MDVNGLNSAQIEELLKPFDDRVVETRRNDEQKVVPHDYVRARLSEIFGPLGWSEQTLELTEVPSGDTVSPGLRSVAYRARVRVIVHNPDGSTRAFWDGAGAWGQTRSLRGNTPMAIWDLHSDCMNGALSVAFVRATKNLGNQFGLCLYIPDGAERSGYQVRRFLTHPEPDEHPDEHDSIEQGEFNMGYTEDPDAEHELSSPQSL